jgi:hypothetical protein
MFRFTKIEGDGFTCQLRGDRRIAVIICCQRSEGAGRQPIRCVATSSLACLISTTTSRPSRGYFLPHTDPDRNGRYNKGSWHVHILPYIEQNNLFRQLPRLDEPGVDSIGLAVAAGVLPRNLSILRCPSDDYNSAAPLTNYLGSAGPQCWIGSPNCGHNPYQKYCNGAEPTPGPSPPTYPATLPVPTVAKPWMPPRSRDDELVWRQDHPGHGD